MFLCIYSVNSWSFFRLGSSTKKLERTTLRWIRIAKGMHIGEVRTVQTLWATSCCFTYTFLIIQWLYLSVSLLSLSSCGAFTGGIPSRGCKTRGGLGRLPGFPETTGCCYQSLYRGWVSKFSMETWHNILPFKLPFTLWAEPLLASPRRRAKKSFLKRLCQLVESLWESAHNSLTTLVITTLKFNFVVIIIS